MEGRIFLLKIRSFSDPSLFPNDCPHEKPSEAIFSLGFVKSSLGLVRSLIFSLLSPSCKNWSSSVDSAISSPVEIAKGEVSSPLSIVKTSSDISSRRSWSEFKPKGLKTQCTFKLEAKRITTISRPCDGILPIMRRKKKLEKQQSNNTKTQKSNDEMKDFSRNLWVVRSLIATAVSTSSVRYFVLSRSLYSWNRAVDPIKYFRKRVIEIRHRLRLQGIKALKINGILAQQGTVMLLCGRKKHDDWAPRVSCIANVRLLRWSTLGTASQAAALTLCFKHDGISWLPDESDINAEDDIHLCDVFRLENRLIKNLISNAGSNRMKLQLNAESPGLSVLVGSYS